MTAPREWKRRQVHHPVFARVYERVSCRVDARGGSEHSEQLLAGLAGSAVEIGAGNGRNFSHYPGLASEIAVGAGVGASCPNGYRVSSVTHDDDGLPT